MKFPTPEYAFDSYDELCLEHEFWSRQVAWWRRDRAEWAGLVRSGHSLNLSIPWAARSASHIGRCLRKVRAVEAELTRRDLPAPVWS